MYLMLLSFITADVTVGICGWAVYNLLKSKDELIKQHGPSDALSIL